MLMILACATGSLGPEVRQTDYDFLTAAQVRPMIQQEGIAPLSYQPLQQALRLKALMRIVP
jgi:diketogulonate reductase-like aldo/keto reductase